MSADPRDPVAAELFRLFADLDRLLAAAAADQLVLLAADDPRRPQLTWQQATVELRDLIQAVIERCDEGSSRAFFSVLIELAARHGRRAGPWV